MTYGTHPRRTPVVVGGERRGRAAALARPALATAATVALIVTGLVTPSAAWSADPDTFRTSFESGDVDYTLSPLGDSVNLTGNVLGAGNVLAAFDLVAATASAENPTAEVVTSLIDEDPATKWLAFQTKAWAQYQLAAPSSVTAYALTSANDESPRDPRDFRLQGSNDGTNWTTLDSQVDQTFADHKTTNTYELAERSEPFTYFRLDITRNNGSSNIIQLADWSIFDSTLPSVASPVVFSVSAPKDSYTAKSQVGFTGVNALGYEGRHLAAGEANATTVLYTDVNTAVGEQSQLNYKIFPALDAGQTYAATFAAIDLVFTDGTVLSQTDATDAYGYPVSAREQGRSNVLWPDQWNSVTVDLAAFAGKTISSIRFVYDHPGADVVNIEQPNASTVFRGWIDDISIAPAADRDTSDGLVSYVDTRRGTNSTSGFSRGNNIPAAAWPNGFNFITPMTNANGTGTIYQYQRANDEQNRASLNGIGFSHQPSIWMGDRNQLAVIPAANTNPTSSLDGRRLTFTHENEVARPDIYQVAFDNGITTAVTPTDHGAIYRFTFAGDASSVLIDQVVDSSKLSVNGSVVSGWVDGGSGWPGRSRMFVYGEFDATPTAGGAATQGDRTGTARFAAFDTAGDKTVELRVASSFISQDQAQHNYNLELAGVSFETAHDAVRNIWNDRLSVVTDVSGATDAQLVTLYSSLYRLNAYPNSQFENTGTAEAPAYKYASPTLPRTGNATDTATNVPVVDGKIYVNNGFWDTYRTAWPLYSLLYPDLTEELVDGFVEQYRNGGWIARWSSPGYADLMTGTSSDVSFAEAYLAGSLSNATALQAFDAAIKNATVLPSSNAVGRKGLDESIFLGYPQANTHESASWGLEGYINDFGIAEMAEKLADDPETPDARRAELREQASYFRERSNDFVQMFNPEAGTFTARNADGSWAEGADFDKKTWGGAFTEASAWTFGYHGPQNVDGLAALYGGRQGLIDNLHSFLSTREKADHSGIHEAREARDVRLGMLGFSNQVAHHIPYILAEAGDPAGAQALIRDIENRMFVGSDIGQGYPGDEDNGEMSAWYVFSALGFYPLQVGSGNYTIGTPLFDGATVNFGGKSLRITADGASAGKQYVAGVNLNGTEISTTTFDGAQLRDGGTLAFSMSDTPTSWGAKDLTETLEVPKPLVDATKTGYGTLTSSDGVPVKRLTDDNMRSSVKFDAGSTELTWTSQTGAVIVHSYTLTSRTLEDAPVSWTLSGSNDGQNWDVLDARENQTFTWADQTRPFTSASTGEYTQYRLALQAAAGQPLALDEIELFAHGTNATNLSINPAAAQTTRVGSEFSGVIATVLGEEAEASGYTVTVDYGDGQTVDNVDLRKTDLNGFAVRATHVFQDAGVYTASVTVRDSQGSVATTSAQVEAIRDETITGVFNGTCIGDLHITSANCDGQGYGYDRAKLQADGFIQGTTVSLADTELTYDLPAVEPGAPDNVTGEGQTFHIDLGVGATQIAVIGSATEKSRELAATLTYADGTTQPLTIGLGDWVGASGTPQLGNSIVAVSEGRLSGRDAEGTVRNAGIYATAPVALATDDDGVAKTAVTLTLPQEEGTLRDGRGHIFAIASDGDRTLSSGLTVTAADVVEQQAGTEFEALLATTSGGSGPARTAIVNWGDGSPVSRISLESGDIAGGHTYAAVGEYTVHVTVDDTIRSASAVTSIVVGAAEPTYSPTLTAPTEPLAPGTTFEAKASGFAPGETVEVTLGSEDPVLATADDAGAFTLQLTVPAGAADGTYPISAIGVTSKAEATASITVRSAPTVQATSVELTASATEVLTGVSFGLTAAIQPATASGQVVFLEGDAVVGSATVTGGTATADVRAGSAGAHVYTARFLPDQPELYSGSESGAVTVTVTAPPPPASKPQLKLDKDTVAQGGTVTVTASGFGSGEQVAFELHSDPIALGTFTADAQGVVHTSLTVPTSAPVGGHTLIARGPDSGEAKASLTVREAGSGTDPSDPNNPGGPNNPGDPNRPGGPDDTFLGITGSTIAGWTIGLAVLLLAGGAAALIIHRVRRRPEV